MYCDRKHALDTSDVKQQVNFWMFARRKKMAARNKNDPFSLFTFLWIINDRERKLQKRTVAITHPQKSCKTLKYIYTYTHTQIHTHACIGIDICVYSICIWVCAYIHNYKKLYCNTKREKALKKTRSVIIKSWKCTEIYKMLMLKDAHLMC